MFKIHNSDTCSKEAAHIPNRVLKIQNRLTPAYLGVCIWMCVPYPVTLRKQPHTGSRQDCQQLLEGHEGFLEVKGQF